MRVIPILEYLSRRPDREDILQVSWRFYEEFLKASPQNSQTSLEDSLRLPHRFLQDFLRNAHGIASAESTDNSWRSP